MLRKYITDEEYSAMEDYRSDYCFIGTGKDYNRKVKIADILSVWAKNKTDLFNLFHNNLKITKSINYTRSKEETIKQMYKVNTRYSNWSFGRDCRKSSTFVAAYQDWVHDSYSSTPVCQQLLSLVNHTIDLVNNRYSGSAFTINLPNGKPYTISTGCKVLKALGKIASAFNIVGFEDFRICHSLVLNDNTLKGELTLSIHPLDYWTMSDNECDWASCMSWNDYGAYRQGTVEMMNSPYVIVAYLSASEPMEIGCDNLPWSNKKWRQLFIVDENFAMGIKSYPYENEYLTKEVLNWIAELGKENMGWEYGSDFHYYQNNKIYDLQDNVILYPVNFYTNRMYNDVGCCDKHWLLLNRPALLEDGKRLQFNFSGETQCMYCGAIGEKYFSHMNETALCCEDCDEVHYCRNCDCIITDSSDYYIVDGEYYCYDCYCDEIVVCEHCNENIRQDEAKSLRLILSRNENKIKIYDNPILICPYCFEDMLKEVPVYNDHDIFLTDLQNSLKYRDLIPHALTATPVEELQDWWWYEEKTYCWEQTNAYLMD